LHIIETFCTGEKENNDINYTNFLVKVVLKILEEKNIKTNLNAIKLNFLDLLLSLLEKKIKNFYKDFDRFSITEYFPIINDIKADFRPLFPFKKIIGTLFRYSVYQKRLFQKSPHCTIDFVSHQLRCEKIKNFQKNGAVFQQVCCINFESIRLIKNNLSKI